MITSGVELFHAVNTLMDEGVSVSCVEVRSKKGVQDGMPIVICVRRNGSTVELLFSFFAVHPRLWRSNRYE